MAIPWWEREAEEGASWWHTWGARDRTGKPVRAGARQGAARTVDRPWWERYARERAYPGAGQPAAEVPGVTAARTVGRPWWERYAGERVYGDELARWKAPGAGAAGAGALGAMMGAAGGQAQGLARTLGEQAEAPARWAPPAVGIGVGGVQEQGQAQGLALTGEAGGGSPLWPGAPDWFQRVADWAGALVTPMEERVEERWEAPFARPGQEPVERPPSNQELYEAGYNEAIGQGLSERDARRSGMRAIAEAMAGGYTREDFVRQWAAAEQKPGIGGELARWTGRLGGVGTAAVFEEPARVAVTGVGAGLLEAGYPEAREMEVGELAPVARTWPSATWPSIREAMKGLAPTAGLAEGEIPKESRDRIGEALGRIRAGEDPEAVVAEYEDPIVQMAAEVILDPLNLFDIGVTLGKAGKMAGDVAKAERGVARLVDEVPELKAAVEETRRALAASADDSEAAINAAIKALGEGRARMVPVGEARSWAERVRDIIRKPVELVPEAKAERDVGQVWIVMGGPLSDARSGDEALALMREWVENPEALRGRYGATVGSEAGQKARAVFAEIYDEAAELPSVKAGAEFNPAQFAVELEELALDRLRRGYGWKEPNRYVQFANAWKGLQSEFYLTGIFSPGYLARNTASDLFTMATDGLATFDKVEDIDRYLGELGTLTTRRVTTGGRGAKEALTGIKEGKSKLPGLLGKVAEKGQEITRYGEPLGRIPIGEEPRYKRGIYVALKRFFDSNAVRMTPDLPAELRVMVGEKADDLIEAVAREINPAEKRRALDRVLGARSPGEGIALSKYLDLETLDAMSPEMYRRVRDRLGDLPAGAGPADVRAAFDEAMGWVDEWEGTALRGEDVVPGRKVATDAEEAEIAEAVLVELRGALERSGMPPAEVERLVGAAEQRIRELEAELDAVRAEAVQAAADAVQAGDVAAEDALEVMLAANRDVDRMRDGVRKDLGAVMAEARDAYRKDPARGAEIWPPYFQQVAAEWEAAAGQRIGRYGLAREQLERLAGGETLEAVLGMDRRALAEARLRQVVVPEELALPTVAGEVFEPGSVLDAGDTAKFDQFLEARRRQVDVAQGQAWRRGFGAGGEQYGDVLDLLDSAARDVEFYGRKAAAEVAIAREAFLDEMADLQKAKPKRWKLKVKAAAEQYYKERNRLWGDFFKQAEERWVQAEVDVGRVDALTPALSRGERGPAAVTRPGERVPRVTAEGMRSGVMNPEGTRTVNYRAPAVEGGQWEVDFIGADGKVLEVRAAENEAEARRLSEMGQREADLRARAVPSGEQSVVGLHSVPEGSAAVKVRKRGNLWTVEYSDPTGRVLESYDFGSNYPAAKAAKNRAERIMERRARTGVAGSLAEGRRVAPEPSARGVEVAGGYTREQWGRDLREVWGLPEDEARAMEAVQDARARVWARQTGRDAAEYYAERMRGAVRGGEAGEGALFQEGQRWFYKAEQVVAEKMPARASVEQVRSILTKGGVKKDELEWSGVLRWLDEQDGPLTREDVLGYLQENRVQVEEVVRGAYVPFTVDDVVGFREDPVMVYVKFSNGAEQPLNKGVFGFTPGEPTRLTDRVKQAAVDRFNANLGREGVRAPKYGQYTLPGGEEYRELLLTLPVEEAVLGEIPADARLVQLGVEGREWQVVGADGNVLGFGPTPEAARRDARILLGGEEQAAEARQFRSGHWDEPNVVAHVRFNERTGANGERVLFIEEIQSDWHQAGREQGYRPREAPRVDMSGYEMREGGGVYGPTWDLMDAEGRKVYSVDKSVMPDAEEARDILFREYRQVLEETGAARMRAGVPAAPFAKSWDELTLKRMMRWAAENDFDAIAWTTGAQQAERYDLAKVVDRLRYNTETGHLTGTKAGKQIIDELVPVDKLPEYIGKEASAKLLDAKHPEFEQMRELAGEELTIGGEGMKGFYDRILPYSSDKLTKRWGVKVGDMTVEGEGRLASGWKVRQQPAGTWAVFSPSEFEEGGRLYRGGFATREDALRALNVPAGEGMQVHGFALTPEMKADLLGEGLPMFQGRKGAVEFMEDGRAVMRAFEGADVSTVVHEVSHVWRRDLADVAKLDPRAAEDLRIAEEWAGVVDGNWTRAAEETWARGIERYFAEGKAPIPELAGVFDRFKEWLVEIYRSIKGSEIDVQLTDEVRGVFDRLLDEQGALFEGRVLGEAERAEEVARAGRRLTTEGTRAIIPKNAESVNARVTVTGDAVIEYRNMQDGVIKREAYKPAERAKYEEQVKRAEDVLARRKAGEEIGELDDLPEGSWFGETAEESRRAFEEWEQEYIRQSEEAAQAADRSQRVPGDVEEAARQRGWDPARMTEEDWYRLAVDLRADAGHAELRSSPEGLDALARKAAMTGEKEGMYIGGYYREVKARRLTRAQEAEYRARMLGAFAGEPKKYYKRQRALVGWYTDLADDAEVMAGGGRLEARRLPDELLVTSSAVEDAERTLQRATEDLAQARAALAETEGRVGAGEGEFSRMEVTRRKRAASREEKRLEDLVQEVREGVAGADPHVEAALEDAERALGVERGRGAYNAAVAEVGAGEAPARAELVQSTAAATRRGLEQMRDGLLGEWDRWRPVVDEAATRRAAERWFDGQVLPAWYETRATALQYAKNAADFALLNYRNRRSFDMWLSMVAPYSYWYTRSGWNWGKRLAQRPGMLSQYLRVRRAQKLANENAGRRARFETKFEVPFPWLPDWMGDSVYVDPLRMLIPFAAFEMTDWDDPEEARKGLRAIYGAAERVGLRPYHFLELPYKAGWLQRAGEAMGLAPETAREWLGPELAGPEGPVGDFGFILPQTRAIRSATAGLREAAPGLAGWVPPGGVNIEAPVRRLMGLPAGEVWDPYRVGRMLANMAADDPRNYELARAALMAQELVDRDEDQVGQVWRAGSELAGQVAAEMGWSAEELAAAQEVLQEAMQRTALEQGVGSVGWAMGPSMAIEPTGERARLELAEEARGMGWSPETGLGSREQYKGFREEYPALEVHGSQYALVPGEEGYTPGMRAGNLERGRRRDEINAEYDRRVDELLRRNPWDWEGRKALEAERQEALDAAGEYMGTGEEWAEEEPLYGESPLEYGERQALAVARSVRELSPSPEDFTGDGGEIDWGAYYDEYDRWLAGLPESTAELDAVRALGGRYAGLTVRELVEAYGQRYDSPLEALAKVYKDEVVGSAWEEYRRLVDGGMGKGEAYDQTVGQIGAMAGADLIPMVLRVYTTQGWTAEELGREYEGVRFPPAEEQGEDTEVGRFWDLMQGVPYGASVRDEAAVRLLLDEQMRGGATAEQVAAAVAAVEEWVRENPKAAQAVEEKKALDVEIERRWPGIREVEDRYFDFDAAGRRAYLEAHPELRDLWDYRDEYREAHPVYTRYYGRGGAGGGGYGESAERRRELEGRVASEGWRAVYGEPWWEKYGLVGKAAGRRAGASKRRWIPAGRYGRWRPPGRSYGGPFRRA